MSKNETEMNENPVMERVEQWKRFKTIFDREPDTDDLTITGLASIVVALEKLTEAISEKKSESARTPSQACPAACLSKDEDYLRVADTWNDFTPCPGSLGLAKQYCPEGKVTLDREKYCAACWQAAVSFLRNKKKGQE